MIMFKMKIKEIQMKTKQEMMLTVKNPKNGQIYTFQVEDDNTLILMHPTTNMPAYIINIETANIKLSPIGTSRSTEDTGKCIVECARDCNGSALCAAGCVAMCSTIIFD